MNPKCRVFERKINKDELDYEEKFHCIQDSDGKITFFPTVGRQRYLAVLDTLTEDAFKGHIKKVVDFGCSTMRLFPLLKTLTFIEHIIEVDIDEVTLNSRSRVIDPLIIDYLKTRSNPLVVDIFAGSIGEQDFRLKNTDAVICIELIEHLYSDVLEQVPLTVFGFIKPNVAIFTTPNADFNNILRCDGFRHDDHKFEWTREEFYDWCSNIILQYPEYDVYFMGIGPGPIGSEDMGCCTQMAVFHLKQFKTSYTFSDDNAGIISSHQTPYKLLKRCEYPYFVDKRTSQERFQDELRFFVRDYSRGDYFLSEDGNFAHIPLAVLLPHLKEWITDIEDLRKKLREFEWAVKLINGEYVIEIDKYPEDSSSDENENWSEDDK